MTEQQQIDPYTLKFPRYGCPGCNLCGDKFNPVADHMWKKKHLYEGNGTYPILVQDLAQACAMGYVSFPECAKCREETKAHFGGCWPGWQVQHSCLCAVCPLPNKPATNANIPITEGKT